MLSMSPGFLCNSAWQKLLTSCRQAVRSCSFPCADACSTPEIPNANAQIAIGIAIPFRTVRFLSAIVFGSSSDINAAKISAPKIRSVPNSRVRSHTTAASPRLTAVCNSRASSVALRRLELARRPAPRKRVAHTPAATVYVALAPHRPEVRSRTVEPRSRSRTRHSRSPSRNPASHLYPAPMQ